MNSIEISLIFSIYSESLVPSKIEEETGLRGDRTLIKGEYLVSPTGKISRVKNKRHALKLYKNKSNTEPEVVLDEFISSIEPYFNKISSLKDVSIEFSLGIYHNGTFKGIDISQELMNKMMKIHASLSIALYDSYKD